MDAHALEVIEFPRVRAAISREAVSALGRELVDAAVPETDPALVRRALDLADEMAQAVRWDDPVPMRGIADIRPWIAVAGRQGSRIEPDGFHDIARTIEATGRLRSYFASRDEKFPRLWDIAVAIEPLAPLAERIDLTIDPSGGVRDSASPKLGRIRRETDRSRQDLRTSLDRLVNRLGSDVLTDRIVSLRDGRPVIPVRASHRNSVAGVVHDQSATGQTLFVEPFEAVEEANRIRQLEVEEAHEVERILVELTDSVREKLPALRASVDAASELDALFAVGEYARKHECVTPRLTDDGTLELIEMRHPLLDTRLSERGGGAVPLTCRIPADTRVVVVSGPNAGGKTVALKTIGLAVAMTQAGFLVPAGHLTALPVVEQLFAEIGDEQSIENDLSTFSSRMGHLARICDDATGGTLVLVDELGAATDPEQGAALSRAILERIQGQGARAIVTTHLGSLKEFAHERPWATNASMEFDRETLTPTFRFVLGIPGSSYALEISRRVGLPPDITDAAERELGKGAVRTEQLIADLTSRLEEVRARTAELEARERDLEKREDEYADRFATVAADRKRMVREAREQAERIVSDARSLVERTVAELRRTQASTEAIRDARHALQGALETTRAALRDTAEAVEAPTGLAVGAWVRLRNLGTTGELVALARDRAAVQTESARLEVPVDQIEKVADEPPERKKKVGVAIISDTADTFRSELDLRGMHFDEAWSVLDRYLDEAVQAQYPRVRVIHGKGTGALRAKIGDALRLDERVKGHGTAELNEGGAGVTIVDLIV